MVCFNDKKRLPTVVLNELQSKLNIVMQYPVHVVLSVWQYLDFQSRRNKKTNFVMKDLIA